jgi:hypothetical protein
MHVTFEGRCCTDCILYLANGDCGDDETTEAIAMAIEARWSPDEARNMVADCGEECDEEFSWSPCEACGSRLGGARHLFAILGA